MIDEALLSWHSYLIILRYAQSIRAVAARQLSMIQPDISPLASAASLYTFSSDPAKTNSPNVREQIAFFFCVVFISCIGVFAHLELQLLILKDKTRK